MDPINPLAGNPETLHQAQPLPPRLNKATILILSVLVLTLLGSTSYLTYQNMQLQKQISQLQPIPTPIPSESPPQDPTASWRTYTSNLAGYSFKYPTSLPLETLLPNSSCATCVEEFRLTPNPAAGGSSIVIGLTFKDPRIKTLSDYRNIIINGDSSIINVQNVKVGSEDALSYKLSGGIPPLPIIEYVVVKNNFYYVIRLLDTDETNKNLAANTITFNQILSTFKFTNTTVSEEDQVQQFVELFAQTYVDANWTKLKTLLTSASAMDMTKNEANLTQRKYLDYRILSIDKNSNPDGYKATIEFSLNGKPYTNPTGNPTILVVKENGEWRSMTWYLYQ